MVAAQLSPLEERIAAAIAAALIRELKNEGQDLPPLARRDVRGNGVSVSSGSSDEHATCETDRVARVTANVVTDPTQTPC
jgi:hypothetical protein